MSLLKPEQSVGIGLGVAGLVWSIHQNATPTAVDTRTSIPGTMPHDSVAKARRQATFLSIAAVSGIGLLTRDATVTIFGFGAAILVDWWTRYNHAVDPQTGKAPKVVDAATQAATEAARDMVTPPNYGGAPAAVAV